MLGRNYVAITLAVGLATAVVLLTAGVLYDAIASKGPGLSDNATQILTTAFGGIIGVLGTYLGAQIANGTNGGKAMSETTPEPAPGNGDVAQPDEPGDVAQPEPEADTYDDANPNDAANE